jgi:hypothetical protein
VLRAPCGGGVGHVITADRPLLALTVEEAQMVLDRKRAARVGNVTTAQQALDRFHDEHSPLGLVRWISRPVDEEDDGTGRVLCDGDPWA